MSREIVKGIISIVLGFAITYCVSAYTTLELNPLLWGANEPIGGVIRALVFVLAVVICVMTRLCIKLLEGK